MSKIKSKESSNCFFYIALGARNTRERAARALPRNFYLDRLTFRSLNASRGGSTKRISRKQKRKNSYSHNVTTTTDYLCRNEGTLPRLR